MVSPGPGTCHMSSASAYATLLCAQGQNKGYWVARKKMATSAEMLCRLTQTAFREFTDSVMNAKFEEEPNYARYIAMFEPLVNVPERPLVVENALKVGVRRGSGLEHWWGAQKLP